MGSGAAAGASGEAASSAWTRDRRRLRDRRWAGRPSLSGVAGAATAATGEAAFAGAAALPFLLVLFFFRRFLGAGAGAGAVAVAGVSSAAAAVALVLGAPPATLLGIGIAL